MLVKVTLQRILDASFNKTSLEEYLNAPEKFVFRKMGSKQQIPTSPELQKTAREKQNERSVLKIASSLTQSAAGEQPRASY